MKSSEKKQLKKDKEAVLNVTVGGNGAAGKRLADTMAKTDSNMKKVGIEKL